MKGEVIKYIVTVEENHKPRINEIAQALSKMGFNIDNILKITGVIIGSLNHETSENDLKIQGVRSVESDKKIYPL